MDNASAESREEMLIKQTREEVLAEFSEKFGINILEETTLDLPEAEHPWIIFTLDHTEYAINSKYVLCIEILEKITPVVDMPHFCPGVTKLRGDMISLLDLRALFGWGDYRAAKSGGKNERVMMVVTEIDGVKRGVIVDAIVSVEYITNFVNDVMNQTGANDSRYIRQIARREKLDSPVLIIKPESLCA